MCSKYEIYEYEASKYYRYFHKIGLLSVFYELFESQNSRDGQKALFQLFCGRVLIFS